MLDFSKPEDRIKGLKMGLNGKTIEALYLVQNGYKLFAFEKR